MNELRRYKNVFFLLTAVGAVLSMICDLFLLYAPGIRYEGVGTVEVDYHFLHNISNQNLWIGQTLGLIAIPFHFFGFLMIFPLLEKVSLPRKIILGFAALLLLIYGIHFHGLMLPTAELLKSGEYTDWIKHSLKPVETCVVILFAAISILLGIEINAGRTQYSKKSLLFLPIVPYIIITLAYALGVPGSNAVIAMGLNLTFLSFFMHSYYLLGKSCPANKLQLKQL